MKKLLIATVAVMAMLFGSSTASATTPVKQYGQLQVKGTQLCDQQGNPVVLRGISLGWHNIWPRFYNKKCVNWLVDDWHVSIVRAAMGVKIEDNYLENPDFAYQCIEPVIKAAIKKGIYVIIDWHAHDMYTAEATKFFGGMAQKYGKYPNVIYEIFNEPVDQSWESLKDYSKTVITEIRKYDPDNIILVGCPHWDQDIHLVAESPLTGFDNIMYTVHFYAATHGQYLRDRTVDAIKKGIPVFLSECGASEADGNGKLDEEQWNEWIKMAEDNKISWVNWSLSDKDETCSMLLPRAAATGKWKDDVLKKTGKLAKKTLLKYNK